MKYKTLAALLLSCSLFVPAVNFAADQTSTAATTEHHVRVEKTDKSEKSARVDKATLTTKVDINSADAKELATLRFIGVKKAEAIVAYRENNGPFKSSDDLLKVRGISQRILTANQERIVMN